MSKIRRFSIIIYILTIPVAALACGRQQGQNSCQGEAADSTTCSSSSEPSPVANSRAPVPQDLAPLPGTGPVFAYISDHGYLVSWTAATDDRTAAENLEYKLVSAAQASSLATVQDAASVPDASVVLPWTKNALSAQVSGTASAATLFYAVLVRDQAGNTALYPGENVTTLVQATPTIGSSIFSSQVTTASFQVNWGAALNSGDTSLSYKVVYTSLATDINTVEKAEGSAATVVMDWTLNKLSTSLSGLSLGTAYAVSVLVKNTAGGKNIYPPITVTTLAKRFYVTSSAYSANLTSASVVDSLCNSDPAKPSGSSSYKAVIAASWRRACTSANCTTSGSSEHTDWPLAASMTYGRADGTVVGKTNALGLLPNPLLNAIAASGAGHYAWSGLNSDWTSSSSNCANWSNTTSSSIATAFDLNGTTAAAWLNGLVTGCNSPQSLLCVEL